VDLIGHGSAAGERPAQARQLLLEDALRVLPHVNGAAAVGRAVHLVGHSYGGAVALKLANLVAPGSLRSLALYEPVAFRLLADDGGSKAEWRQVNDLVDTLQRRLAVGDVSKAAQLFINFWSGVSGWDRLGKAARAAAIDAMPVVMQQFYALLDREQNLEAIARLQSPALVLSGARTVAVARRIGERLRALWPQATHRVLSEAGHMGPLSHPEEVNRHISAFLATADQARSPSPSSEREHPHQASEVPA
jgi:pimeloyl-ACP methyl ester carboxylesterase